MEHVFFENVKDISAAYVFNEIEKWVDTDGAKAKMVFTKY